MTVVTGMDSFFLFKNLNIGMIRKKWKITILSGCLLIITSSRYFFIKGAIRRQVILAIIEFYLLHKEIRKTIAVY